MNKEFTPDPVLNEKVDKDFKKEEYVPFTKPVYVKAADAPDTSKHLSQVIRDKMKKR